MTSGAVASFWPVRARGVGKHSFPHLWKTVSHTDAAEHSTDYRVCPCLSIDTLRDWIDVWENVGMITVVVW